MSNNKFDATFGPDFPPLVVVHTQILYEVVCHTCDFATGLIVDIETANARAEVHAAECKGTL